MTGKGLFTSTDLLIFYVQKVVMIFTEKIVIAVLTINKLKIK